MSKHKPIPKKIRIFLYDKYHHRCAYCGCPLNYEDMQIDHVESVYANTDFHHTMSDQEMYDSENLLPACRQCNFYKSTMTVEQFRNRLSTTLMNNLRNNFNYKLAVKHGLVEENIHPIKFYFEQCDPKE